MASLTNTITLVPANLFFDNQLLLTAVIDGNTDCYLAFAPNLGYGLYQVSVAVPAYNDVYAMYMINYNKTGTVNYQEQGQRNITTFYGSPATTIGFSCNNQTSADGKTMTFGIRRVIPYY